MPLDLMIPFHLRHPLEPLLIGSVISLVMMFIAFTAMARARSLRRSGRRRVSGWQLAGGPLIGLGAYLATMALVTTWVGRPYLELLFRPSSLIYLAMGVAIGCGMALLRSRFGRIAAGAALGSTPILTVLLRVVADGGAAFDRPEIDVAVVISFIGLAAKAGLMTGTAAWLATSESHITRAGAALFATSALTMTLSAVPTVLGQSRTVWSVSTGIVTPYAAWSATAIVFFLILTAIFEHFRLLRVEGARRELQRSQDRLDGLTKASFEGLVVHRDGIIVDCNERFREMSLWRPFGHLPPAHVQHLIEHLDAASDDVHAPTETVLKCRDGRRMPVEVLSQPLSDDGEDATIVTAVRDITQRKEQDAALAHMARHDGLTGLLNRTAFQNDVAARLAGIGKGALLLVDLDHFKPVNDTHGHPAGDRVLQVLARRFQRTLREDDLLARLGGDEFAAFVADPAMAAKVGARLVARAAEPIALGEGRDATEVELSASVGIAVHPVDAADYDTLLLNADAALYRAKGEGRDRVARYDPRLHAFAEERARMAEDLKRAVRDGGLTVAYQPIFDVASGEAIALEALARWDDAYHGTVEPDVFLPLAEEAHLMVPLGAFVMREAFATCAATGLRVCVNVAPQQIAARGFAADVEAALAEAGIEPAMVEFEVTERVLRETDPVYQRTLESLAGLGLGIVLDDFGTGPSALSALHRFPFSRIKLDGGFLRRIDPERAHDLLSAMLRLARVQRLEVTAEGIESHSQLALMTRVGLDAVQGYLLARPGEAASAKRRMDEAA